MIFQYRFLLDGKSTSARLAAKDRTTARHAIRNILLYNLRLFC